MNILLAADGSPFTKKALAWLVANDSMAAGGELAVLNVQPPLPAAVRSALGATAVRQYYADEAARVLAPIERFLARHTLTFRTQTVVGHAAEEIVRAATRQRAQLVVMGTHGHGLLGRALMGSVAQKVVGSSSVPVLLVK
jgi:nucleotide-binding universal stress UspA family protein